MTFFVTVTYLMASKIVRLQILYGLDRVYIFTMKYVLLLKKIIFLVFNMSSESSEQPTDSHVNWSVNSA